jgi:hypothetical protein
MNRDLFVRVATTVLNRMGDPQAAEKAEAIATQMDVFAAVMGDAAVPAKPAEVTPARPAFPPPNPEAVRPQSAQPSLIIPATSIPDRDKIERFVERQAPPQPAARDATLRVEDVNLLIQKSTPPVLTFDVPMEGGGSRRMSFERNVISRHGCDSVALLYFPPGTTASAQEATQVQAAIHIDDWPIDIPTLLRDLTAQAIQSVQPRQIREVMPLPSSGPVRHAQDTHQDPSGQSAAQNVFNALPQ